MLYRKGKGNLSEQPKLCPESPRADDVNAVNDSSDSKYRDVKIEEYQTGIWRVLLSKQGQFKGPKAFEQFTHFYKSFDHIRQLYMDIYTLSPTLFLLHVLSSLWSGLQGALMLYYSSEILRAVEAGLKEDQPTLAPMLKTALVRMLWNFLISYINRQFRIVDRRLQRKVQLHFELRVIRSQLGSDVYTARTIPAVEAFYAWDAFDHVNRHIVNMTRTISHIAVTLRNIQASFGPVFVAFCLGPPIINQMLGTSLFDKTCYLWIDNSVYLRTQALRALGGETYRQDVICGDLRDWIVKEIQEGSEELGDLPDILPWNNDRDISFKTIFKLLSSAPLVMCLLVALSDKQPSVATVAILQSSLRELRANVTSALNYGERLGTCLSRLGNLYKLLEADAGSKAALSYPPNDVDSNGKAGMKFELRNVSFAYPGSKNSTKALDGLDLTIPAGSVVVIVGTNGSGKSTLVRILSCLSPPTSGDLMIDGHPAKDYDLSEIRQASAILSQDSQLYPLSFAENIGLGCVELMSDMALVKDAAERGGAAEFISKMGKGYDTVLDAHRFRNKHEFNLPDDENHPLQKRIQSLPNKKANISGGERQRVIAARSFMRLHSGKIKFVAVDEPSSALDAEAELRLFQQLLAVRDGKTLVFVTHRFGHLTKFADMILCMKGGRIVETGTHAELMSTGGEYAKLYDIQAGAFSEQT
ncbi:ATP-binding cassette transporter [Coprinopsis cinerea AmutBmut pab1-1]|nr:ATP-binding cassette transporter [Coprinopsis cinerea AmutBmut pab1-1]